MTRTTQPANVPIGPEVAPPRVFHGHHFIEASGRLIITGDLKLYVSIVGPSSHECKSRFALANFF